jgi:glycosyltransferase involved in cell wall biosynthesis
VQRPPAGLAGRPEARAAIRRGLSLADDQVVLLTLGRLVRRKGVRWFTEFVLPQLGEHVHYVVAGEGPEEELIRAAAGAAGVSTRLHLLGRVADGEREELLTGADVFLQPNIPVPGDIEGFGLVTVEAAMRGTPVVAAKLEGIQDAVVNSRTGILLPPADAAAWVSELNGLLAVPLELRALGDRFRADAEELYSEEGMGRTLCAELAGLPR